MCFGCRSSVESEYGLVSGQWSVCWLKKKPKCATFCFWNFRFFYFGLADSARTVRTLLSCVTKFNSPSFFFCIIRLTDHCLMYQHLRITAKWLSDSLQHEISTDPLSATVPVLLNLHNYLLCEIVAFCCSQ